MTYCEKHEVPKKTVGIKYVIEYCSLCMADRLIEDLKEFKDESH